MSGFNFNFGTPMQEEKQQQQPFSFNTSQMGMFGSTTNKEEKQNSGSTGKQNLASADFKFPIKPKNKVFDFGKALPVSVFNTTSSTMFSGMPQQPQQPFVPSTSTPQFTTSQSMNSNYWNSGGATPQDLPMGNHVNAQLQPPQNNSPSVNPTHSPFGGFQMGTNTNAAGGFAFTNSTNTISNNMFNTQNPLPQHNIGNINNTFGSNDLFSMESTLNFNPTSTTTDFMNPPPSSNNNGLNGVWV